MSEPAKVRLVRCPKCENILQELPDYSIYQCGGCGAVLRAKNKNVEAHGFSEKSDEERVGGVEDNFFDKSENLEFLEKQMMNLSDGSGNDVKSNGSSTSRAEKTKRLGDKPEKYSDDLINKADKWVIGDDMEINMNVDELGHVKMAKEYEDLKPPNENVNRSRRSRRIADWNIEERDEMQGFQSTQRIDVDSLRYSTSKYPEDGSSNYQIGSGYGNGEPEKNRNDPSGFNKVEYLEQDRAELLRKLDELKDQLSRSCDVADKLKEKPPLVRRMVHDDRYGGSENWFPDGSLGLNRPPMQHPVPDKHVARPYVTHYAEPSPFMSRHEMAMRSFYSSMHTSNQVQGYGDPFRSQMLRRAHQPAPAPFQELPSHPYFTGQFIDNEMVHIDPFEAYPQNVNLHQPSCSCFHCYNKHQQILPPVPVTAFCDKRFSDVPNNSMFYHHENHGAFDPRDYNPRIANPPPLSSRTPQLHARWPSDLNSEVGGFVRRGPPRVLLATGGRHCRPIAGGSPFVACYNCFELLQLPKKIFLREKTQKKMRCGACSTVILLTVANKRLLVSVHSEANRTPANIDDSLNVVVNEGNSHTHAHVTRTGMNFSSDDYDNSGYDFQSMERETFSPLTGQGLSSNKSAEMRSLPSTSCTSEDEAHQENLVTERQNGYSSELPIKANESQLAAGSPLQDHLDYSNKYDVINRFGKGNRSGRSEQDKVMPKKATLQQNYMKDASIATEMEISSNEYSNTGTSQESGDTSREEDQQRGNKGGESFFAGIIKKSFRDFSRSNQTVEDERTSVTVNGHPIPSRLLKKAEKLAGPVHPGQYWYDFRAGFWGVMGGPCLGIIPPFIEEFNYPMPENCAGGNTGVFVNGRELYQRDLDLLTSRGLPTARDRSYIVEISGRVLDEDSGEELDCLGKLAPTVERAKHGFGMKVPRVASK